MNGLDGPATDLNPPSGTKTAMIEGLLVMLGAVFAYLAVRSVTDLEDGRAKPLRTTSWFAHKE